MAAGLVALDGPCCERAMVPTPARSPAAPGSGRAACGTTWPDWWQGHRRWSASSTGTALVVCGVGCGGPMSPGGEEVSPLNIAAWRVVSPAGAAGGADRAADLRRQRRQGAGARARAGWAPRPGCDDYIAMVVSTGVGGGIVLDGRLLDGRLGNAGHIGHVVVEPDGRAVPCGGRGCLEAEASGTAIAAITGQTARLAPPDVVERDRHAGRPGHRLGREPARPAARRRERLGGARLRRALLRGGPGGDGPALPAGLRAGGASGAGRLGGRRPAGGRGAVSGWQRAWSGRR